VLHLVTVIYGTGFTSFPVTYLVYIYVYTHTHTHTRSVYKVSFHLNYKIKVEDSKEDIKLYHWFNLE